MRRHLKNILTLMAALAINANAATFDNWKAYMAYGNITDIEPAGKLVYVLSSGSIFSYNTNDGSVTTYDKVYPLSDCTISRIAWNNNAQKLIIIYDNDNIDLLDNRGNVVNIKGYKEKSMNVDKTINNVVINGKLAYLCTAFGLVQINMENGLLMETYNMGRNVTNCAFANNAIYAYTTDGVFKGDNSNNIINPANWLPTNESVDFAHPNDISVTTENGYTQYYTYDKTNKCYWTNQSDQKLQAYTIGNDGGKTVTKQDIIPIAPFYNFFGFMTVSNDKLYACSGMDWARNNPPSIQVYDPADGSWELYDATGIAEKYNIKYKDILCLAVDPHDDSHVMAGSQAGMFEYRNGKLINHFNSENSPITSINGFNGNRNYQIITSMAYDSSNTLWITNAAAEGKSLLGYTADGKWATPDVQMTSTQSVNPKMIIDKNNRIWIGCGMYSDNGVFCYSADKTNLYSYTNFVNEDGKAIGTIEFLRQVAEDKDGNIWVATSNGLLTLTDEYQRNPSLGFYQIKVPRNDGTNYADYLLDGANITAIAVDNANRKWIGTLSNGVYVISNDNMVQEAHFKADDSFLLSDNIQYITINDKTGRVYIGTDKGLCSVESHASETFESMDKDNVWAYPNPVKPDYTGMVTVVGLSFNADVKITTTNGVLVAKGRSTGGSFQWDCRDLKGKRVASGVYMVNTATESGESGTVCKIAVIN